MVDDRIQRVTMPKWGLSMTSGTLTEWLVDEGTDITSGTELAEVETDKIAGTLEADQQGTLRRIVVPTGSSAPVGSTIAVVAPAEVPDSEIAPVVAGAEREIAAGAVVEDTGPAVASVDARGYTLSYAGVGEGDEAVLLVHGFGGDKNSWLFVQEPLAVGRSVYALDLPGHGTSSKNVGDGGVEDLVEAVLGFLDGVGVQRAHLVGHSLGGAVVTAATATAPERASSLTLVAPAGFGSEINGDYLRGFTAARTRRELKPHVRTLFADESQVTRHLVDDLLQYKRLDGVTAALETLQGTLLDGDAQAIDAASALQRVTVPVTAVWGRADEVLPVANATALPHGVDTRLVDAAGHMVHMEAAAATRAAIEAAITARPDPEMPS